MLKFLLVVNKQGQQRVSRHFGHEDVEDRLAMELDVIRKVLSLNPKQCSFMEYRNFSVVCRKYLNLFFIIGMDAEEIDQNQELYTAYSFTMVLLQDDLHMLTERNKSRFHNELAVFELIHSFVETLDKYFERVSEIDIMYNLDKVHMMIDEMILNGHIVEMSQVRILAPIQLMDTAKK